MKSCLDTPLLKSRKWLEEENTESSIISQLISNRSGRTVMLVSLDRVGRSSFHRGREKGEGMQCGTIHRKEW